MNLRVLTCAAVAALASSSLVARATVTYDTSLASPNSSPANNTNNPSWFNGNGNQNTQGGFTVSTDNGVEIGLRAKYRQNPAVINSPTNHYTVVPGPETTTTSGGVGSAPTLAAWNFEFSVDVNPGDSGSMTLADIETNTRLIITDVTTGSTNTLNPITSYTDDSGYGSIGTGPTLSNRDGAAAPADWVAQNSENPVYPGFPAGFNMNAPDTYEFELDVINDAGALLASDTIFVNVVPLPSSATAGLALIAGLGLMAGMKRLRRQTTAEVQ